MGPLACLSLFAVMFVDKSHLLRFRVSNFLDKIVRYMSFNVRINNKKPFELN